jgi:hypothetical protein
VYLFCSGFFFFPFSGVATAAFGAGG